MPPKSGRPSGRSSSQPKVFDLEAAMEAAYNHEDKAERLNGQSGADASRSAFAAFVRVLEQNPRNVEALFGKARCCMWLARKLTDPVEQRRALLATVQNFDAAFQAAGAVTGIDADPAFTPGSLSYCREMQNAAHSLAELAQLEVDASEHELPQGPGFMQLRQSALQRLLQSEILYARSQEFLEQLAETLHNRAHGGQLDVEGPPDAPTFNDAVAEIVDCLLGRADALVAAAPLAPDHSTAKEYFLLANNHTQRAMGLCSSMTPIGPQDRILLARAAVCASAARDEREPLIDLGLVGQAVDHLGDIFNRDGDDRLQAHCDLADIYFSVATDSRHGESVKQYLSATAAAGQCTQALAARLSSEAMLQQSVEHYRKALSLNNRDPNIFSKLGDVLLQQAKVCCPDLATSQPCAQSVQLLQEALDTYQKAFAIPFKEYHDMDTYHNMGVAFALLRMDDDCQKALRSWRAQLRGPGQIPEVLNDRDFARIRAQYPWFAEITHMG
ncbi:hypothetical protein H696_03192 [Fonticula alba]|uniref:KIF-binding protein n=1 Tax=Fonticula alba TaxID=691883 RepID=A0A058Z982_FONAL|nr:hypothetical protein H696_03192 [Fonticula alba]KCV70835.1 hypothetical protein H696_03192 [Fonticula alba]|eukprot:XP_009495351.1 hypothetical protein H696_03192 [Fonticula alba]